MDILLDMPHVFLGSRLKRLADHMQADASLLAKSTGTQVPPGLYPVLALIEESNGRTVGDLARAIRVSQPAMTKNISKLVEEGLVATRPGEADRRQSVAILTDAGRHAVEQGRKVIWPLLDTVVRELVEGLSGPLLDQIHTLEQRLADCSLTDRAARLSTVDLLPAEDEDVAAVVSLLNRAYRGSGNDAGWTTEAGLIDGDRISEATLQQEIMEKPCATLLVWKRQGTVEGCVWVEPVSDGAWYLGSLAIDPRAQDARFGRRLLTAAEQWCQARGCQTIQMTVLEARETLIAWYERRGYLKTGETQAFPYDDPRFGTPTRAGLRFAVMAKSL